jgi:hypothetical protein
MSRRVLGGTMMTMTIYRSEGREPLAGAPPFVVVKADAVELMVRLTVAEVRDQIERSDRFRPRAD